MPYDYSQWLKDKTAEFMELFGRMDTDKDLVTLKPYTMFDKDNRSEPDVENLTLNDAAVFATRVESNLNKANMQTVVASDDMTDDETSLVEDFIRDYMISVDETMVTKDISSLMAFNVQQICHRGRIATRTTPRIDPETGEFIPGILPMDTRYVLYEYGAKNLKAIAYQTSRNKTQVEAEYGAEVANGIKSSSSTVIVTDLWHEDREIVFVENVEVKNKTHGEDELPFVLQLCPSGLMFMDGDRISRNGESIYASNRALYEPKNKLGSILMTLTIMSFMQGLQYESDQGTKAKKPENPPYGKRFVVPVDKGTKGYFNMPVNDVKNATRMLYSMVESALQQGSLPAVSYGSLQFPLSAVAISGLQEAEDPIYLPRLQALALYYQRLYRMIIKQYIKAKMSIKLGTPGFVREYPYQELDKQYSITFKFFPDNPKQQMAAISVAAALGDGVSDDYKRRNIYHLENPDEQESIRWAEKAPLLSPNVARYKVIEGLIERKQLVEANLMAAELGLTLDQILSGNMGQPVPGNGQKPPLMNPPKQMMPMFAGRIGAGGRQAPGYGEAEAESVEGGEE